VWGDAFDSIIAHNTDIVVRVRRPEEGAPPHPAILADLLDHRDDEWLLGDPLLD